ncbi:hypothetical protein BN2537_487 [Streptomyces venezuelae]|nr:hypothetical protein BN2537_487 [Streptomyces venezuelae]
MCLLPGAGRGRPPPRPRHDRVGAGAARSALTGQGLRRSSATSAADELVGEAVDLPCGGTYGRGVHECA